MKIGIGIIGAGRIAKIFAKGSKLANNAEVIAIASREKEKAELFAKELEIERAYGSYKEILEDKDVKAVYIAVPHSHHYQVAKLCLEYGKAVICEKPMFLTVKEYEDIILLAKEKDLLLMEAMWTRFLPSTVTAHKWIEEGRIGQVKMIDANFGFCGNIEPEGRLFNKDLAGGAIYDLGVYSIELAIDYANSKVKKHSVYGNFGSTDVDETNCVIIEFENGVLATAKSALRASLVNDAYVYGDKGFIHIPNFYANNHITLYNKDREKVEEFFGDNQTNVEGFKYEIEHFANLLNEGKKESPRIPFSHNIECAEIFESLMATKV